MLSDIIVRNTGFIIHRFCSDVRTIALVFLPTINIAQIMLLKIFIHEITTIHVLLVHVLMICNHNLIAGNHEANKEKHKITKLRVYVANICIIIL